MQKDLISIELGWSSRIALTFEDEHDLIEFRRLLKLAKFAEREYLEGDEVYVVNGKQPKHQLLYAQTLTQEQYEIDKACVDALKEVA